MFLFIFYTGPLPAGSCSTIRSANMTYIEVIIILLRAFASWELFHNQISQYDLYRGYLYFTQGLCQLGAVPQSDQPVTYIEVIYIYTGPLPAGSCSTIRSASVTYIEVIYCKTRNFCARFIFANFAS